MTKRETFSVQLISNGEVITTDTAYAWNSGLRKSEALVRAHARFMGRLFHRGESSWDGDKYRKDNYRCVWHSGTDSVTVTVRRVA